MTFSDSPLAHRYLDDLVGIEIGGSAHNPFNLPNCINVDYTDEYTIFKEEEDRLCGTHLKVDVIADGADLPFKDEEYDYVISSHLIEHFYDPIAAIEEWLRVIKPGGYVFMIAPRQFALKGEDRPCTHYTELLDRHSGKLKREDVNMGAFQTDPETGQCLNEHGHWSVWDLKDFLPLCEHMKWNVIISQRIDDKVANGFTVLIQKQK